MGQVTLSVNDRVAVITLDNPASHNAVDEPMRTALAEAYDRIETDEHIRVAIIRGSEGGSFCSGGSIDGYLEINAFGPDGCGPPKIPRPYPARKPFIAAITGYALGGGFSLAVSCDLRVAGGSAQMGPTGLRLGAVQGAQTISRLTRLVGASEALGILLLSKRLGAEEAERIGLVHAVAEDAAVFETALSWATTIAQFDPWAVQMTKQLVYEAQHLPLAEAVVWEDEVAAEGYRRPEALAGFLAFRNRRRHAS